MRPRVPPNVAVLVLGVVLAAFAFQWGLATAASQRDQRRRTAVVDVVAHASPAVVNVEAVLRGGYSRGAGSGVVVHPLGYVVTNSHVIRGASRVTVKPFGARERHAATVVTDVPSKDLALLKVQGGRRWPYVSLSRSRDVLLGETAIAIGNPRGLGDTITVGVVSAKGRVAKVQAGAVMRNLIQTDAAINSGSSGGPLLNLDGELIGINASMLPSAKGIAFAIPADDVEALLRRALGRCAPPNPLPPPACEPLPPPVAPGRRIARTTPAPPVPAVEEPENVPMTPSDVGLTIEDDGRRLVVRRVRSGSPAADAGLAAGDVLLDVDGFAVEDVNEVRLAFAAARPGRVYEILVRRGKTTAQRRVRIPH